MGGFMLKGLTSFPRSLVGPLDAMPHTPRPDLEHPPQGCPPVDSSSSGGMHSSTGGHQRVAEEVARGVRVRVTELKFVEL